MKHLFVVNPVAGGKDKTDFVAAQAAKLLDGDEYEVYTTKAPMDAVHKIKQEAQKGGELRVYACGGDGTLNECVNGTAGFENAAVTHFPCGTGNDFIKMFGEDKEKFFNLENLINGEIRRLDLIRCNERYSMNICSVGLDARIGSDVHRYSRLPLVGGAFGYVISTLLHVLRGVTRPMRVESGGQVFEGERTLVCVCNGRYYGGGFHPMPDAMPDDGLLECLVVGPISRLQVAGLIGKYAAGRYAEIPRHITFLRGEAFQIDLDEEGPVNVDGEILRAKSITMTAVPGAIRCIFPKGMEFFRASSEKIEENKSKYEISRP